MFSRKSLLAVAAVIAGLLLPSQAMAQFEAFTRVDLNLRIGPGTGYGVIDVIPYGDPVHVFGCLDGVEWCDIEWYGLRGWVAAYYLVQPGTSVYLPQVYAQIGVPIIVFSFDSYHDRYYRDRPWYKKRVGIWQGEKWRRGERPKNHKEAVKPPKDKDKKQVVLPPQEIEEVEQPRKRKKQEAEQPQQQQQQKQKQKVERSKNNQEAEVSTQGERKQSSKEQAKESDKEAKRAKKKRGQEEEPIE